MLYKIYEFFGEGEFAELDTPQCIWPGTFLFVMRTLWGAGPWFP